MFGIIPNLSVVKNVACFGSRWGATWAKKKEWQEKGSNREQTTGGG